MDESILIKSISEDSNSCLNDTNWNWHSDSFQKELDTITEINEQNSLALRDLGKEIRQSAAEFNVKNPVKSLCNQTRSEFIRFGNEEQANIAQYKSELQSINEENKIVKRNIVNLHEEAKRLTKEIEEYTEKRASNKKVYNALDIASNIYQTNFNIKIDIENMNEDTYLAKLYFSCNKTGLSPIQFTVSRLKNKIIDLELSLVLTKEQEKGLKLQFNDFHNIPALVCELRKIL